MASMGSLGHYMQETSRAGFHLRDFLHEGNGDIWLAALDSGPQPFAEWVLIEEKAEGGDMLAMRAREQPQFLDGYSRVCEGAGLALYHRTSATTEVTGTNGGPETNTSELRVPSASSVVELFSESEVHREQIVEAAEIDLRPR